MDNLEDFINSPTRNEHTAYKKSFFKFPVAPEYATGEVVLASLYRNVGYQKIAEGNVPKLGKEFSKIVSTPPEALYERKNKISPNGWDFIINEVLTSPKQPSQSSTRFLQLTPLTPSITKFTSSARMTTNPWNPGNYLKSVLEFSDLKQNDLESLWENLFQGLSIQNKDDFWAQYVEQEIKNWDPSTDRKWQKIAFGEDRVISFNDAKRLVNPSHRFARDLKTIIGLKEQLSRRQWTSLLESLLRICSASFTLWLCHLHAEIWKNLRKALNGDYNLSFQELTDSLSTPETGFLEVGEYTANKLNRYIRNYFLGRLGINTALNFLSISHPKSTPEQLSSINDLQNWFNELNKKSGSLNRFKIYDIHKEIIEMHTKHLKCKKGIPQNLKEFLTYCLTQRQTSDEELKHYDQGYYMAKSGKSKYTQWKLNLGPVSALLFTYCCVAEKNYPRTLVDLCDHLKKYGLNTTADEVPYKNLGKTLMNLNLVLDSPDAEGGMVLSSPF